MPAISSAGAAVTPDELSFLFRRHLRGFFRIEAHGEDIEFSADVELQDAQRAFETAQHFAAEHWALVVNQVEDHRLLAEIVTQLNRLSGFIAEREVAGNGLVQMLLDTDVLQARRTHVRRRGDGALGHALAESATNERE